MITKQQRYSINSTKMLNDELKTISSVTGKSYNQIIYELVSPIAKELKVLQKAVDYIVITQADGIKVVFIQGTYKPIRVYSGKNQALNEVIG